MAQSKAQLIGGLGISTAQSLVVGSGVTINSSGINASGIITASNFVGNITGNVTGNITGTASTASFATTSFALSGTPNITVGVATATSFIGNLTGNVTGTASTASFATTSFALSGTPNISVGIATATEFDIFGSSNTLTTGGLTVGIATATTSVRVGSAVTLNSSGINVVGVVTSTSAVVGSAVTINSTGITGVLANYSERINVLGNTGTASTINLSNGNFVTATLTADCTFTFTTGIGTGTQAFTLFLTNDATPNRVITWPVTVKWPNATTPVRTTTANKTDVYSFFTFDNGTNWYGTLSIYNYS